QASFGPNMDGGWYLAALAAPRLELFDLASEVWDGPVVMARTLEVAQRLDIEVGLLRMERRLETAVDAAAFLADPLTPTDIAQLLGTGVVQERGTAEMGSATDPNGSQNADR
ncbi:MAG: uncharacterized protein QOI64_858, partial [Solirubrobacteraceae bacterium]|nr:uncharacterized protein [Solirubrobacteraceae bacterium]